jgi:hypothetical protein
LPHELNNHNIISVGCGPLVSVMGSAFNYVAAMTYQELLYTLRYSETPPGLFGGLLTEATRAHTLEKLQGVYATFQALAKSARTSSVVAEEMRLCVWPLQSWVLEIFVALDEVWFRYVPAHILEELVGWSRCPKTTKLVENLFNYCRGVMTARAKTMAADRVQHSSIQSGLDVENGRPISKPSPRAKLDAPKCIDKAAFQPSHNHGFTLGDTMLEDFVKSKAAEMSSECYMQTAIRWLALQNACPAFEEVSTYWRSLLVDVGDVLWEHDAPAKNPLGVVLGACERGVVIVPIRLYSSVGQIWAELHFPSANFSWIFVHVGDSRAYKAVKAKVVTHVPGSTCGEKPTGLLLHMPPELPGTMERLASENGFKELTISRMQQVAHDWEVPLGAKVRRLEKDWALLLVEFFRPELDHAGAMACVLRRNMRASSPFTTVITEANLHHLQKQGELDEDDLGKFGKVVEAEKLANKVSTSSLKVHAHGDSKLGGGFGYVPKGIPNKALSLAEARAFCPTRAGCVLCIHKDAAWIAKTPYRTNVPKSKQVQFAGWGDNRHALVQVLRWAWDVEKEMDPTSVCPFPLDDGPKAV